MTAAIVVHVVVTYGALIVAVNEWVYFKNGVKELTLQNISTFDQYQKYAPYTQI